jgi:hypothetical protein
MGTKGNGMGHDHGPAGASFANGNGGDAVSKALRDSGFAAAVQGESSWTLTLGMLPA